MAAVTQSPVQAIADVPFKEWDKGIFTSELVHQHLFPRHLEPSSGQDGSEPRLIFPPDVPRPLSKGTFDGSKAAMTEMYRRIEDRFASFFDIANFEPSIPQAMKFQDNRDLYTFQPPGSDEYPPHLNVIPPGDKTGLLSIFNAMRLLDTGTLLGRVVPGSFEEKLLDLLHGRPDDADTIAGLEARNKILRSEGRDVEKDRNIGDRLDWYTDKVFAQQRFTGVNPMTITTAENVWVDQFKSAAKAQGNEKAFQLLSSASADSLYIQDYSYYRDAIGVAPDATMQSEDGIRFACAPVTLFQLSSDGQLHPLAIVIDYKKTIEASVVAFNARLHPSDPADSEATDWPWRYAKLCAQVADWTCHEITVHLVNTHFVEEVVIVAAHRAFEDTDHLVYRLLSPHWLKTLSLNHAARSTLVPQVITQVVGITDNQLYAFARDAYSRFDWTAQYVPNDLVKRGFPSSGLASDRKFHNYAYGRNIDLMWKVIRNFVSAVIATGYTTDAQVANDTQIFNWGQEMRGASGGAIGSFPSITTIDGLVDAIVMCIHIASPQHTAVNYLQEYYQTFVINRPPALWAPLPKTLEALRAIDEPAIMKALPAKHPREWLLSSHLPALLSFRVAEDQNLPNYAVSLARLAAQKGEVAIAAAAANFFVQLTELTEVFHRHSNDLDDQNPTSDSPFAYAVMDPQATAISILI